MRRFVIVGVLVFAGLATMGISPPITHVPPTFPVGNPAINDQERFLAMLSVHHHARFLNNAAIATPFMSLIDAVNILRADTGEAARSRRRRAVAKLAAYNFTTYRPQVQLLGGSVIVGTIDDYYSNPAVLALSPIRREADIFDKVEALGPGECKVRARERESEITPPLGWKYRYVVERSMAEVARATDPQSWSECRTMFQNTRLVEEPGCCPLDPVNDPKSCSTGEPLPGPTYERGRPYGKTAFFESFCATQNNTDCPNSCINEWCDIAFQNVLCVQTEYDVPVWRSDDIVNATTYDVHYSFGRFLFGELLGRDGLNEPDNPSPFEIDIDEGTLHIGPPTPEDISANPDEASGWTSATITKDLSFKDSRNDEVIGETLEEWTSLEDELGGQIVELICCDVMAEEWGSGILAWLGRRFRQILPVRWPIWREPGPAPLPQ